MDKSSSPCTGLKSEDLKSEDSLGVHEDRIKGFGRRKWRTHTGTRNLKTDCLVECEDQDFKKREKGARRRLNARFSK